MLDALAEDQLRRTGRVRKIVLKARQEGVSTWVGGRIYRGCTLWQYRRGMVLADDLDRTAEIFTIYERFDEHSALRPPKLTSRRSRELAWALDQRLTVETARDKDTGRGGTLDYAHCSEFALWPYPADTLAGIIDSVPEGAGEIWIESTAQGVGNEFHAMWEAAVAGESEWEPIFLPWWIDPGYRRELEETEREVLRASLDRWERDALMLGIEWMAPSEVVPALLPSGASYDVEADRWRLTLEQLAWRRRKIRATGELTFRQENPSTADEAFLVSGSPYFDQEAIRDHYRRTRRPLYRGNFLEFGGAMRFDRGERGYVRVFEEPDPDGHYVLGADTAEGKLAAATATTLSDPEGERGGRDFCDAEILKVSELVPSPSDPRKKIRVPCCRLVASIHGRMDPDIFAQQIWGAACWWSCPPMPTSDLRRPCLTAPERNHDSGQSVIRILRERYRHPDIYLNRRMNWRDGKPTMEFGWITDGDTRMPMLDELAAAIRDGTVEVLSAEVLRECNTFVRNDKGRPEAQEGTHDDRVIAFAIALQMGRHYHSDQAAPPMPLDPVPDTPTGM